MKRVVVVTILALQVVTRAQDPASIGNKALETGELIKKTVENHLPKKEKDGRFNVAGHKLRLAADVRDPGVHGTTFVKGREITLGVSLEKGVYGSTPAIGGPMVLGIGLGGHIHAEAPIAGQHYKIGNGLFDIVNDYESGVKASRALSPIIVKQGRQLSKQTEKLRQSAAETTQKAVNSVGKRLENAADKFKKIL